MGRPRGRPPRNRSSTSDITEANRLALAETSVVRSPRSPLLVNDLISVAFNDAQLEESSLEIIPVDKTSEINTTLYNSILLPISPNKTPPTNSNNTSTHSNIDGPVTLATIEKAKITPKKTIEPQLVEPPSTKPIAPSWSSVVQPKPQHGMSLHYCEQSATSDAIDICESDVQAEIDYWKYTLMGNVLGSKPQLKHIEEFVKANWGFVDFVDVKYYKKGWFSFRFQSQDTVNAVLKEGPWQIGGCTLILKQWTPLFSQELETVSHVPVWVLFPDLDPFLWSESVLSKMASKIGKPLFADLTTTCKARLSFARVMIEVDVSQSLPTTIPINTPYFGASSQRVIYEWLPYYCKECGKLSHSITTCRKAKQKEKDQVPKAAKLVYRPIIKPSLVVGEKHTLVEKVDPSTENVLSEDVSDPIMYSATLETSMPPVLDVDNSDEGKGNHETEDGFTALVSTTKQYTQSSSRLDFEHHNAFSILETETLPDFDETKSSVGEKIPPDISDEIGFLEH